MRPIRGVYEVVIPVRRLAEGERFYREVLGLEVGFRDERRKWLFLRVGGDAGMLVLQETPGEWPPRHFAFTIDEREIAAAVATLRAQGVIVDGPHFHEWMPATSAYFTDPDGHDLELCAPGARADRRRGGAVGI